MAAHQKRRADAPARLVPGRSELKLLNSFAGIRHRGLRRCLIDLVDAIAKAEPKKDEKRP